MQSLFVFFASRPLQDLKSAKLLIGPQEPEAIGRTHRLVASLFGGVLLSASVLRGQGGYKMCFKEGVEQNVRIFLTDAFKAENHGLTLVIREACSRGRGWKGVTLEEARKKAEQATVGVRKLQHFLCKDPTAYGATGQN